MTPKLKDTTNVKNVLENLKNYKMYHKCGNVDFNNRDFDPFHVFVNDYNPKNLKCILEEDRTNFFPKPECYKCSGDVGPRPMTCSGSEGCYYYPHGRGKNDPDKTKSPVMEVSLNRIPDNISIFLSRPTISWLLDHQEFNFIVRTSIFTKWVFHHRNIDGFDDSPGNIRIVRADWHLDTHRELKDRDQIIAKYESMLLLKNDVTIKKELEIQKQIRSMLIERLANVPDDPDILRILTEVKLHLNL